MRTIVNHLWWCWHRLQIGFNHKCTILYCFSLWIIVTGDWFWTKWKQAIKLNYTQNTICKRAAKVQNESVQKHGNLRRKGPIWLEPVLWVLGGETLHHRQNSLTSRLKQIKNWKVYKSSIKSNLTDTIKAEMCPTSQWKIIVIMK